MAKLKNIIKQLPEKDYQILYTSMMDGNAEKSASLLKSLREKQLSDYKIMLELGVSANAYYTLRSRLNMKIEEYLMAQLESPRTDILRKVANINEVLFTKKKAIAVATLKKLEKELIDYDLANELTIVYKSLKKIHINSQDRFHYSQMYNRHVAYMLAVDKAEDMLANYFRKYGDYYFTGNATEKMELGLLAKEMVNVSNLYQSHRLYVYKSCMLVFHRLFVEPEEPYAQVEESIEDVFAKVHKIFNTYNLDSIYYHLNLVFEYLKLEYYNHYKVYRQSEKYYEEINDACGNLLINYNCYTFPAQFLISKVKRHVRMGTEADLIRENENIFLDFDYDVTDTPTHTIIISYQALSLYYAGQYEEAAVLINQLLADVSLKKYPFILIELKAFLALLYVLSGNIELFNRILDSLMRHVRMHRDEMPMHAEILVKIMKIATSEVKKEKDEKISLLIPQLTGIEPPYFSIIKLIRIDEAFVKLITSI